MPTMTGFCSHPSFADHDTGPGHPEQADRIRAIHRAVRQAGLVTSVDPFPDFSIDLGDLPRATTPLVEIEPAPIDDDTLRLVHSQSLIDHVRGLSDHAGGRTDADTVVGRGSFEIAKLATGAVVAATEAVLTGRLKRAFAAVRPPGHHAEPDRSMGFCFFSNVAIAVRVAQQRFGVGHVAVVDFDVHHGNGTQAVFEEDPSVLVVSLHQDPRTCYPGTGYARETGRGLGRGFTLNIPLPPGTGDEGYLRAIDELVIPRLHDFGPEVLFLSAGFDAHAGDPLADMAVTDDGFGALTHRLVSFADIHCAGRLVSALEGGYNLRALARSVVRHLEAMSDHAVKEYK
jgi:acetoin utilization deacetylase AcuC-like enzyme